jgi:hypothetical protein
LYINWQLKINTGRDKTFSMTDWIEKTADRIKQRVDDARNEQEVHSLNAHAVQIEMPRIWESLVGGLMDAVNEFNSQFLDSKSPEPKILLERTTANSVNLSMNAPPSKQPYSITVSLMTEREEIECKCFAIFLAKDRFYFKASNGGDVYLMVGKERISEASIVRVILEPLFSEVYL